MDAGSSDVRAAAFRQYLRRSGPKAAYRPEIFRPKCGCSEGVAPPALDTIGGQHLNTLCGAHCEEKCLSDLSVVKGRALRESSPDEIRQRARCRRRECRVSAARDLVLAEMDAVPLLCSLLRDREFEVREAAARSLGWLGDERAVQPLLSALRNSCWRRDPRKHLGLGVLKWVVGVATLGIGLKVTHLLVDIQRLISEGAWGMAAAFAAYPAWVCKDFKRGLQQESDWTATAAHALATIARTSPSRELYLAAGLLDELAMDGLHRSRSARKALHTAAEDLRRHAESVHTLPISTTRNAPCNGELPLPSQGQANVTEGASTDQRN